MRFILCEDFGQESTDEVKEKVADLCHKQWSGWMEYLFSKCETTTDGTVIIPKDLVDRWKRQVATDYSDLSKKRTR